MIRYFHSDPVAEAVLPISLRNQNSTAGKQWQSLGRYRKRLHDSLWLEYRRDEPFDFPVALAICRRIGVGQRVWDNDAVAIASKQLIDCLVALGWFVDDSDQWVKVVAYYQDRDNRHLGPAVIVTVFEATKEQTDE